MATDEESNHPSGHLIADILRVGPGNGIYSSACSMAGCQSTGQRDELSTPYLEASGRNPKAEPPAAIVWESVLSLLTSKLNISASSHVPLLVPLLRIPGAGVTEEN